MKEVIVLQHINIEDPGHIKDLMIEDNINLTTIELDEGEKIPNDLSKFDAMFCMGGPMDTWMEKDYPWLIDEKKKIKEFVIELKKRIQISALQSEPIFGKHKTLSLFGIFV